jgi:integrase
VRDVKAAPVPPKNLSHKDEERLVHAVKRSGNVRNIAIVRTMLHCGLRCGEMVNFCGAPFAG